MFTFSQLLCLVLGLLLCYTVKAQVCTPRSGAPYCVCETSDGKIDLTSLSDAPELQGVSDTQGLSYNYNPCWGSEDSQCSINGETSSVCQIDTQDTVRSCGLINQAEFRVEGSRMVIQYNGGVGGRISLVNLYCDQSRDTPLLIANGDFGTPLTYYFELHTKCACKDACPFVPRGKRSGSGGIQAGPIGIVLIVLFILAWPTYFITGAIILKFKFDKSGLDLIPQRTFWMGFFGLVKDGFLFTFGPIIRIVKEKTGRGDSGASEKLIPS